MPRTSVCGVFNHKRDTYISHSLPTRLRDNHGIGARKRVNSRGQGVPGWNSVFWHYRAIALMTSQLLWLSGHQISQHSSLGRIEFIYPTPSWGAMDSWWLLGEGESVFFKGVIVIQWMAQTHEYMSSTNRPWWAIKK